MSQSEAFSSADSAALATTCRLAERQAKSSANEASVSRANSAAGRSTVVYAVQTAGPKSVLSTYRHPECSTVPYPDQAAFDVSDISTVETTGGGSLWSAIAAASNTTNSTTVWPSFSATHGSTQHLSVHAAELLAVEAAVSSAHSAAIDQPHKSAVSLAADGSVG